VEQDHHLGSGDEFDQELTEDGRDRCAVFVKKDAEALHGADGTAAVFRREDSSVSLLLHEVRGWEAVCAFGGPLLLFAEAPEDEKCGEDAGECQCEPSSVGDFGQSG